MAMSVTPNQIILFGSANMPEADGVTVGGAIDFTKRVSFQDIPSNQAFDLVSSSASDTAVKCQITGRDSTGTIQTPAAVTLTGTTLLASSFGGQVFQRLLAGVITGGAIAGLSNPGGTAAVGDVAVISHTRAISAHTAQVGSANTTGTTPPVMKLQAGDGATIAALTYAGLGLIIRTTGGTGPNQLRMISAQYSAGAYGTDVVAVNRDWGTVPDATTTYDIGYGFLFDVLPAGIASQTPVTAITRCFATAQADVPGGSNRTFYEKIFSDNVNTVTALTAAALQVLSETPALPGTALLDMALTKVLNDTATVANRQTLPANGDASALTFVAQPAAVNVIAAPNSLPSGAAPNAAGAQGIWLRLTLPNGTTAYQGAAVVRATGSTT
jgi:hypothetical protein